MNNFSGHVGRAAIFSRIVTSACCLVVGSGLGLGLGLDLDLDLVRGWLVVMHAYLNYFR